MSVLNISRRQSRRLLVAGLLALPMLAGAAWWQASPALAVARLQQAALAGDAAQLAARVDFPALRQSLKVQLRQRLFRSARPDSSGLSGIGRRMALAFNDPMVDAAVTPETVQALAAHAPDLPGSAALGAIAVLSLPELRITRDGLDRFAARPDGPGEAPALLFCRDGLSWRLCGVALSRAA